MDHGGITVADMECILDLVDICYESATKRKVWACFLDRVGEMFDAPMRHIQFLDANSRKIKHTVSSNIDGEAQRIWADTVVPAQGEWSLSSLSVPLRRETDPNDPLISIECRKDARRVYDSLADYDIRYCLGTKVRVDSSCFGMMGLMRRPSQAPFDAADLARMKILGPHINRAMTLFAQSSVADRQRRAAFAALNHIAPALAVLEGSGHVVYHNEKMRMLAREGDVSIHNGRVHATSPQIRARILTAVRECHQAVLNGRPHLSRAIAVPRSSERSPLAVLVGSTRGEEGDEETVSPLVVLLATDPDARPEIQRSALSELYGMTGAEADVAGMLAEGFSPDEIAHELGISMNTVRTHMKRVFEKTRVGRQADLVRVLLTNPVHSSSPSGSGEDGDGPT